MPIQEFHLWRKFQGKRVPFSFDIELTSRCNNNCRHCCINTPIVDIESKKAELTFEEIKEIAKEAVSLGAVHCLITGGEPLIREDFPEIYVSLKKIGLLVSVFTNGTLLSKQHVRLFQQYPPMDIEVSVYGITKETYELVTRTSGSFAGLWRGLGLLFNNNIKVRLKSTILRTNFREFKAIEKFCKDKTKDCFRFDPFLLLRYDRNEKRNVEIISERLTADQIVGIERSSRDRLSALRQFCDEIIPASHPHVKTHQLFRCGAGTHHFTLGHEGLFHLCSALRHPDYVYDLRRANLTNAWNNFVIEARQAVTHAKDYLEKCSLCNLINLCLWCPAHAYLETGKLDSHVEYFCSLANARAKAYPSSSCQ